MMHKIKQLFSVITADDIARHELAKARIELLQAHAAAEYTKMTVEVLTARVRRLECYKPVSEAA